MRLEMLICGRILLLCKMLSENESLDWGKMMKE